jgi:hypothetical protein
VPDAASWEILQIGGQIVVAASQFINRQVGNRAIVSEPLEEITS